MTARFYPLEYPFLTRATRIRAANVRERCRPTEQLLAVKTLVREFSARVPGWPLINLNFSGSALFEWRPSYRRPCGRFPWRSSGIAGRHKSVQATDRPVDRRTPARYGEQLARPPRRGLGRLRS